MSGTTVLIVNYNGERWIERCLDSVPVSRQVEVILVDNGSTDGSLKRVRVGHPGVRVLELGENFGFGAANNRGAELASGERLLLLNPDAWIDPGALYALGVALDRAPRVAAVAPLLRDAEDRAEFSWYPECGVLGEAIQRWRNGRTGRWARGPREALLRVIGPGWLTAACLLVRREAFRQVGGFDERFFLYFEDVDLCRRLTRAGWKLAKEERAGAVHVGSVGLRDEHRNGGPGRAAVEYRVSQLLYYRKHRPSWEVALLRRRLARRFCGPDASPRLREGVQAALQRDREESIEGVGADRGLW
jgi:hypothetical protein